VTGISTGEAEKVTLPETIGPFRILRFIGRGGMGVVYEAERISDGQRVAVKTVAVNLSGLLRAIRVEIAALRAIRHPGVIRILDDGLGEGAPWYSMEILEGRSLAQVIRETWRGNGPGSAATRSTSGAGVATLNAAPASGDDGAAASAPPPPAQSRGPAAAGKLREMLLLFRRLCEPLAFIHGKGIVHRDLKPENVFIRPDGDTVLMDFGLVSYATGGIDREVLTSVPTGLGTVAYVSPEQIRGQPVDARADLYSLGCMLYEVVTGSPPFEGHDQKRIIDGHLGEPPTPAAELVSGVPEALDQLLLRLLAKNPENRFGHIDEIADALDAVIAERRDGSTSSPGRRRTIQLQRPRITGREDVLRQFDLMIERVEAGRGTLVVVGGESGVGKTFVASEITRRAHRRKLRTVVGGCAPIAGTISTASERGGRPLNPLRGLLQMIADHCVENGPAAARRILGEQGRYLVPYEAALAPLVGPIDGGRLEADLPSPAARERLFDCLMGVVSRFLEEGPLVLVIDDLQWADELTLAFLTLLGSTLPERNAVVVIGTYRSEEVIPPLESLIAVAEHRIKLSRLSQQDIDTLASDMLAPEPAPAALVHFLADVSEGNPFFAAEYLRFLVAKGHLHREAGQWTLSEGAATKQALRALPDPRSLTGLIRRRLEVLAPGTRTLIEVASVLGREFDDELLATISGLRDASFQAALAEAVDREVVEHSSGRHHRFVHDKLREVSYAGMPPEQRIALHRTAAHVIEARGEEGGDPAERYPTLAHHYREGGEPRKALEYAYKAAQISLDTYSYREAIAYLRDALRLDAELGFEAGSLQRARWFRQLGDAHQGLGQMADSETQLKQGAEVVGYPFPRSKGRMALSLIGQVVQQILHRLVGGWFLFKGRRTEQLLEAARIHDRLQQISFYRGEGLPIFYAGVRALNLAERAAPSSELAAAYTNAHAVTGVVPMRALSEAYCRRARATLETHRDPAVESYLMLLHGVYSTGVGRWEEARQAFDRADMLTEALRFRRRNEEIAGAQGVLAYCLGSFDRALDSAVRQYRSATRGDSQTQCWGLLGRAQVLLVWGREKEAAGDIKNAIKLLPDLGRPEHIWAHGLFALAQFRLGALGDANNSVEAALAKISEAPPVAHYCVEAYSAVAEVAVGLAHRGYAPPGGTARTVRAAAGRACRALRDSMRVFPIAAPKYWRAVGLQRWRDAAAIAAWRNALASAVSLAMPYDEGLAHLLLARALDDAQAPQRAIHAARARQLLEPAGAGWALDLIEPTSDFPLLGR
jgi:eukaryotic-like serine/threonine-protein kinase